jgi:hypothetical protein
MDSILNLSEVLSWDFEASYPGYLEGQGTGRFFGEVIGVETDHRALPLALLENIFR